MQNTLSFLSKSPGIPGSLKQSPEDFLVEEIMQDGTVLELGKKVERVGTPGGKFAHFVFQKKNWATTDALLEIAGKVGIGRKSVSCAGSKDRNAVTVQLACAYGVSCERVMSINIKDISILGCWNSDHAVGMGDLAGNRFRIKLSGKIAKGAEKRVEKINSELSSLFPNYFGEQRFGSRGNTHIVGKKILQGNFRGAAMEYLCGIGDSERRGKMVYGEPEEKSGAIAAREAREKLAQEKDFAKAFAYFPQFLKYERYMLSHLAKIPTDFAGAMRKLPRGVLLMFVHAYQSHLFNSYVSERVREKDFEAREGEYFCKRNSYGFPDLGAKGKGSGFPFLACKILGHESVPNEYEIELLEREGILIGDFKAKGIPELGSRGSMRALLAPLVNFSYSDSVFKFDLPAGSYATVALREFLGKKKN